MSYASVLGRSRRQFWRDAAMHFRLNMRLVWPLFVFLLAYLFVSGLLLLAAEHGVRSSTVNSLGDAIYGTWISMTTIGNAAPVTAGGRILTSLDGLMGFVSLGSVVWVVTFSLTPKTTST
jgi:hypothetical protein